MMRFICKKKCFHLDRPFAPGDELVAEKAPKHFEEVKEHKKENKKDELIEELIGSIKKTKKA